MLYINPYIFGAGGPPPPTGPGDPLFYNVEIILIADTLLSQSVDRSINERPLTLSSTSVDTGIIVSGTEASTQFTGTSSYVTTDATFDWMHDGVTPWTLETWLYLDILPPSMYSLLTNFGIFPTYGTDGYIGVYVINDGGDAKILVEYSGTTGATVTSTSTITIDTWTHVVVAFDGYNLAIYLDGTLAGSTTLPTTFVPDTANITNMRIGASSFGGGESLDGNLEFFQITRGTDRYTFLTFTPPIIPYEDGTSTTGGTSDTPTFSNTYLYLPFNADPIVAGGRRSEDYTSGQRVMTKYGSAAVSTSTVKYGASSLNIPSTATSYLSNGTIEVEDIVLYSPMAEATYDCWVYPFVAQMAPGNSGIVFSLRSAVGVVDTYSSPLQVALRVGITTAGVLTCHISQSAADLTATTGGTWRSVASNTATVNDQQWNHIRLAIKNGRIGIWLNGTKDRDVLVPTGITLGGRDKVWMGAMDSLDSYNFAGFIDDFCITSALLSNFDEPQFTVPTQPASPYYDPGSQPTPVPGPDRVWSTPSTLPTGGPAGTRDVGTGVLYFHFFGSGGGPIAGVTVTQDGTIMAAGMNYWRQNYATSENSRVFVKSTDGGLSLSVMKDFYPYQTPSPYGFDPFDYFATSGISSRNNTIVITHNTLNNTQANNHTIVSKTTDGGVTWQHTFSDNSMVIVDTMLTQNGLYAVGSQWDSTATSRADSNSTRPLQVSRSTDFGSTWSTTTLFTPTYWYSGYPNKFEIDVDEDTNGWVGMLAQYWTSTYGLYYVRPTSATTWASPVAVFQNPVTYDLRGSPGGDQIFDMKLVNNQLVQVGQLWNSYNPTKTIFLSIKGNTSGATIGNFQYDNAYSTNFVKLAVDTSGNRYLAVSNVGGDNPSLGNYDRTAVMKLSPSNPPTIVWQKRIIGASLNPNIQVDSVGDVYLTWWDEFSIVKLSGTDGSILWKYDHFYSYANDHVVDSSDNVYTTGFGGSLGSGQFAIVKRNPSGVIQWAKQYNDPTFAQQVSSNKPFIAIDNAGNIIVSYLIGSMPGKILVAKMDSGGAPLWAKTFIPYGSPTTYSRPVAMAIGEDNTIYVVGYVTDNDGPAGPGIPVTAIASDGTLIWDRFLSKSSTFIHTYPEPCSIVVYPNSYNLMVVSNGQHRIEMPIQDVATTTSSSTGWTLTKSTTTVLTTQSLASASLAESNASVPSYTIDTSSYTTNSYSAWPSVVSYSGGWNSSSAGYSISDYHYPRLLILKNFPGRVLAFFWDDFNSRILMCKSTDSGVTWSAPVDIGDFANKIWIEASSYSHVFEAVELENGNVCVIGLAVKKPGVGGSNTYITWYTISTDGGDTFSYDNYAYSLEQLLNPLDYAQYGNYFWFEYHGVEAQTVGNDVVLVGSNVTTDDVRSFRFTPYPPVASTPSTTTTWIHEMLPGYIVNSGTPPYGAGKFTWGAGTTVVGNDTYISAQHLLTKIDVNGNVAWSKNISITTDTAISGGFTTVSTYEKAGFNGLVEKSGSDIIFATSYLNTSNTNTFVSLAKISSAGAVVWEKHYDMEIPSCNFERMAIDSAGNIYVVFHNISYPAYSQIGKFNSSGEFVWRRQLNISSISDVKADSSDNLILLGYSEFGVTSIIKMSSSGSILWSYESNLSLWEMVLDSSDNIYCQVGNIYVTKLTSSGTVVWRQQYSTSYLYYISMFNDVLYTMGDLDFGTGADSANNIGANKDPHIVVKINPTDGSVVYAREVDVRKVISNQNYIMDRPRFRSNGTMLLSKTYSDIQYLFCVPIDGTKTGLYSNNEYRYTPTTVTASTATPNTMTPFSPTVTTPSAPIEKTWTLAIYADTTSLIETMTIEIP